MYKAYWGMEMYYNKSQECKIMRQIRQGLIVSSNKSRK